MGKVAWVFPGQGSQVVGMGKAIAEADADARAVFDAADEALGFALSRLCFEGPEEELRLTVNTQPAILTTSAALLAVWKKAAPRPDFVAGHSLGEYSALVAAEALSFVDAVRIVRQRGAFMEEAVPAGRGGMAAVLGMEREALQAIVEAVSAEGDVVELANLNCPGQIVISGTREGVKKAAERAREAGARRVLELAVSGPFHSSLMKPAAERLAKVLVDVPLADARVPVVANVTARPVTQAAEIRRLLVEQVAAPVLWEDSVRTMLEAGVDTFVEIGPGTVLTGLIKKIDRRARCFNVHDPASLDKALAELA
ncbi:ACP S-malonyltransferase [Calditerricola satsumensis]|uniref:Malonyl CoA-acyl carrier protein transacylase n=1 Tax=Calditerricola satsumensis TaxID=373054 RepID=A0A8J3BF41_9BACI|nr:ACP S-malonyltransferase [Calditerricola satsumensis]GGK04203.1 malonyl CoA-acyl carrier protein transacylase [Calditerricola satsumensis]